jgi:transcriptional regulator with XRE-family HTH domain
MRTEELHDWLQHTADAQIEHVSPSGTGAVQFVVYDDEHLAKREDLRSVDGFHVLDNAAMIAAIRSDLSLQVTEIAEVVGVQRPTIYSWVKGSSVPQRPNRKRLCWLYELACRWRKLSLRPVGAAIRDAAVNGQSLVDMLRDPNADEASILTVFREIAQRQAQQEDQRKPSMREIAEAHGFPTEPRADAQDRIDIITGKRFGLE